jgi:hypothetical protein
MSEGFWIAAASIANWIWGLLNSNFSTALAGAAAGALGAQLIAERAARKHRLLEEIRSTNAAINSAFHIMNVVCTTKAQLIGPMMEKYTAQRERHKAFVSAIGNLTAARRTYNFDVDFQSLQSQPRHSRSHYSRRYQ